MIVELALAIAGTYAYNYLNTLEEQKIKHKLKKFIEEKELMNRSNINKAKIKSIQLFDYGFRTILDISGICGFEEIEKHQDYLKQLFRADGIDIKNIKGRAIIDVIIDKVTGLEHKRVLLHYRQQRCY